jgi:5-methylcytosine-specific restriction endonuclease McrA
MSDARRAALERDCYTCQECGRYAVQAHHIVPRSHFGKHNRDQRDAIWNLITLCAYCHDDMSHTRRLRARHLRLLQQKYGYDYNEQPWRGILESGEKGF